MAARELYEELARQLSAVGAVKREMARELPGDCPPASAGALMLLSQHGEVRTSRLAELMAIDMSVTSRHVAHLAERGLLERRTDPQDGRSRLLRISGGGERLLEELFEHTTDALERHLHTWSEEDIRRLTTLLRELRGSFGECRAPGEPTVPSQGSSDSTKGTPTSGRAPATGQASATDGTSVVGEASADGRGAGDRRADTENTDRQHV